MITQPPPSRPGDERPGIAARLSRPMYAKGHHELSMFPDDESRNRALAAIERKMMPRTVRQWLQFLLGVSLFLAGPIALATFTTKLLLPALGVKLGGIWSNRLWVAIMLTGYTIIVSLLIRRDMPKSLRQALLDLGVPVCPACGYDLRGSTKGTERCPECGKPIDPRAARALDGN